VAWRARSRRRFRSSMSRLTVQRYAIEARRHARTCSQDATLFELSKSQGTQGILKLLIAAHEELADFAALLREASSEEIPQRWASAKAMDVIATSSFELKLCQSPGGFAVGLGRAPTDRRYSATLRCSPQCAKSRDVPAYCSSTAFTAAPRATRARTRSRLPDQAAMCSGDAGHGGSVSARSNAARSWTGSPCEMITRSNGRASMSRSAGSARSSCHCDFHTSKTPAR